jgi:hypothetical protein
MARIPQTMRKTGNSLRRQRGQLRHQLLEPYLQVETWVRAPSSVQRISERRHVGRCHRHLLSGGPRLGKAQHHCLSSVEDKRLAGEQVLRTQAVMQAVVVGIARRSSNGR